MQIGQAIKEPQIATLVRRDVFVEISNRKTTVTAIYGPPSNIVKKKISIAPSEVGWGPCTSSVISASSVLSKLRNPDNIKMLLAEIGVNRQPQEEQEQAQEQDDDDDELEAMFCGPVESKKTALDTLPEQPASQHIDVNKKQREKAQKAKLKELETDTHNAQHDVHVPKLVEDWYAVCAQKLRKSHINDIPKMYRSEEAMPPIQEFAQSSAGDTLIKFANYISSLFR
jgi:hypothetical protein